MRCTSQPAAETSVHVHIDLASRDDLPELARTACQDRWVQTCGVCTMQAMFPRLVAGKYNPLRADVRRSCNLLPALPPEACIWVIPEPSFTSPSGIHSPSAPCIWSADPLQRDVTAQRTAQPRDQLLEAARTSPSPQCKTVLSCAAGVGGCAGADPQNAQPEPDGAHHHRRNHGAPLVSALFLHTPLLLEQPCAKTLTVGS